ncbi:YwiC-like family protein [Actinobacillus equuli]|uniref:YwiC-like family protein n=1 Tax=Actinobacillus equuli TaxID=718 RepID=UPI00244352BB|nr:YwiC-like family protein [Actinobacillus equuli]WGE45636.1 YwiC-like family protein [Actinobacillus equuli subsp. haemolyticus]WGE58269.1 YwiC-like family protein [Actinobacillus equuli subsp. haemolyticus]WGE61133.1 YwiC-like family protein [Actinobacillus equuli subsp. haemolyticus]WGE75814.1 YwiC-like family protein [Actinobacillus equuli subsp. haemolyticus]WGE76451.1 YwiC-like family protein [Actinobacillus equuli subsp. haemolyticus]
MFNDKPVISNQHGALAMAFIPFLYGMFASVPMLNHLFLGLAWLFLYLFSYPFLSLFSKKPTVRNKKWAFIYALISLLCAIPVLLATPQILQFLALILPLAAIQIYYAKQRDERNLVNDIAGYLTFGVIGMASFYLVEQKFNWEILIHPTVFFIGATLYVKSMVRERKNPLYMELSIGFHLLFSIIYLMFGYLWLFAVYLIALARAIVVPSFGWNVKQVGMFEFPVILIFMISLIFG